MSWRWRSLLPKSLLLLRGEGGDFLLMEEACDGGETTPRYARTNVPQPKGEEGESGTAAWRRCGKGGKDGGVPKEMVLDGGVVGGRRG
jgi:hypothetical protein